MRKLTVQERAEVAQIEAAAAQLRVIAAELGVLVASIRHARLVPADRGEDL